MHKLKYILILTATAIIIAGCGASEETQKDEEVPPVEDIPRDTLYIIDDSEDMEEETVVEPVTMYTVQIGAFSTVEKAESFAGDSRAMLSEEIFVTFNEEKNLYVVQLSPVATRQEAESIRDRLWESGNFKDAFIVTITE